MLLPYLQLVFGFEKCAFSYSISFHVLCLPLLILSSILHIVDIVIDVFAAVAATTAAAACYSNFKRKTRQRKQVKDAHRFSSTKRNIYFFSFWIFLFTHSLVLSSAFGIDDALAHTHNNNKKAERRKTQCGKKKQHQQRIHTSVGLQRKPTSLNWK